MAFILSFQTAEKHKVLSFELYTNIQIKHSVGDWNYPAPAVIVFSDERFDGDVSS